MSNQKVVLITGASSGNGKATARLLSQQGYKVFGTSRNPANAEVIPNVEMLDLDVCADDSVEVKPFNVHVSLVEAGFLKTPMMDNRQVHTGTISRRRMSPWFGRRKPVRFCFWED